MTKADLFLHFHSGSVAWSDVDIGPWFLKSLCEVFGKYGKEMELMAMMTLVNREVAYKFRSFTLEPSTTNMKQMPCFTSMLTKQVFFRPNNKPKPAHKLDPDL